MCQHMPFGHWHTTTFCTRCGESRTYITRPRLGQIAWTKRPAGCVSLPHSPVRSPTADDAPSVVAEGSPNQGAASGSWSGAALGGVIRAAVAHTNPVPLPTGARGVFWDSRPFWAQAQAVVLLVRAPVDPKRFPCSLQAAQHGSGHNYAKGCVLLP